ncbi:hypothetical protein Tco_0183420 [Tanacetum coccineum]
MISSSTRCWNSTGFLFAFLVVIGCILVQFMKKGEGEEDINLILNTFTSKMSHIMNINEASQPSNTDSNSFVNVVNGSSSSKVSPKVNFRTMVNPDIVEKSDCVLPVAVVQAAKNIFVNSLVGFFVGKRVAFPLVLENGPWLIRNTHLILNKWTPNLTLSKDIVTKVPVWVKLHKVPVVAYSEDGLSLIATQIGKPSMLDAFTSAMCVEVWGRIGFARALIEVSAKKELKQEVTMVVPIIEDEGPCHTLEIIRVEYKWKPPICESSGGNTKSDSFGDATPNDEDSESKVEETFVEETPFISKGASTPSEDVFRCWEWTSNVALCSRGCRIIVGWNVDVVHLMVISQSSQALHVKVFHKATNKTMFCSFIYTGNLQFERRVLWSELKLNKLAVRGLPWVLMGDFNVALNMEDIYAGSSSLNSAMYEFKDCASKIEVMDINSLGIHYTWNQKPKGGSGIQKKLDRIMGNMEFMDMFPGAFAIFQPYRILDHSPASKFSEVIEQQWSVNVEGHNMFKVVSKLKMLKKLLRKLLHDHGNLHERVNKIRFELDQSEEEHFMKQKAKIDWIEVSGSHVLEVFVSHNEQFLGTSMTCIELNVAGLFTNRISATSTSNMVRDVSNKEIKAVMFGIRDDKSPGPDGYTSAFFKKGWSVVGDDVCNAVRDFFSNGRLLKEINNTFHALIPKVSTLLRVNDYRPISCCNVIYKCISKILTNWIMEGIKEVVSDNQSAFVPGRRISNNILITQELMHNYHRNRGPSRCAFKVDIQKAYDTVDWAFLENILVCFGFPNTMVRWIMACVSSISFSLSINGNIHGFFKGKRGLRQGDPLSPYLFTILMEVLMLILKRRVQISDSFRYHKHCEELEISNVCFADDFFIFMRGRGDVESTRVTMESLEEFKVTLGLVLSLPKSTAYFCNVRNHVKHAILCIMLFSERDLPVKYLVFLLFLRGLKIRIAKFLLKNLKTRLEIGRINLYLLLEDFNFCNGEYKQGNAKVAWDDICLPKRDKGLGLRSLDVFNIALMIMHVKIGNDIIREGFHIKNNVADMITNGALSWPQLWIQKAPELGMIDVPCLVDSRTGMELVPPVLHDILGYLLPMRNKRMARSIFGKLIFGCFFLLHLVGAE